VLVTFTEQPAHTFADEIAVITREAVHPRGDEPIHQRRIHVARELHRVLPFAIVKRVLNALFQQRRNFIPSTGQR